MSAHEYQIDYAIGHPATEGHFEGHPIIPGVVILRDVMALLRQHHGCRIASVRAAKFTRPIVPGETMQVVLRESTSANTNDAAPAAAATWNFECSVLGQSAAKGSFDCTPITTQAR
jgi:3-hydroxyacyl-[acyl-carrier-protein] dehydratase